MKKLMTVLLLTPVLLLAQAPDRSKPPVLGDPPTVKVPPIQHLTLTNGLPILLMEKHGVPIVQLNLLVRVDAGDDPAGKPGLTSATLDMMNEGAGTRTALQMADAIDFLGARLNAYSGVVLSGVSLHTPVSKLNDALPLMADIALRPTFSSEELERKKKVYLNSLLQAYDQPNAIASAMFLKTMWGADHPYGHPYGSESAIRSLTTEDLKNVHATFFHAGNATLVVVGDVTAKDLLPKLESAFGAWKKKEAKKTVIPQPKQVADRTVYLVDKPGSAQSVIRIGRIGASRLTEDYFPMVVMNTLLGGSFTSRLNMNLREKHGYTYGAGSSFDFRTVAGPFGASSSVQTAVTDKALTEFMNELNGIGKPLPEEEATRAKNYLALGYPDNFQSVQQIAGAMQELIAYGLPDTYFNTFIANVLAVKKADMERMAKKYIDPGTIAIVVVGDRSTIEKGIKDLNLGPIVNLTIEDVLGKKPILEKK